MSEFYSGVRDLFAEYGFVLEFCDVDANGPALTATFSDTTDGDRYDMRAAILLNVPLYDVVETKLMQICLSKGGKLLDSMEPSPVDGLRESVGMGDSR